MYTRINAWLKGLIGSKPAHVMYIVLVHEVMQSRSDEDGVCLVQRLTESKSWWCQNGKGAGNQGQTNLTETDGGGLFTETLTAEVKTVFTDDTSLVCAQTTREARGSRHRKLV